MYGLEIMELNVTNNRNVLLALVSFLKKYKQESAS